MKPWVPVLLMSIAATNLACALAMSGPAQPFGFAAAALSGLGGVLSWRWQRAK